MLLKITFLGTSGTTPSVERNPSGILMQHGSYKLLFDCGEGIQRQMMVAKTGFRIDSIFITHLHTDHFLGIFGLLETLSLNERKEVLKIYSPNPEFFEVVFELFGYKNLSFPVKIIGLEDGDEVRYDKFRIVAFKTDHIVKSLGYALIEDKRPGKFNREKAEKLGIPPGPLYSKLVSGKSVKIGNRVIYPEEVVGEPRPGRKVVYTGDTRPCNRIIDISADADVLIHDAAFTSELQDWAEETKHSTAREAAETAKKAGVRLLVLTHISTRYSKESDVLLQEAKEIFDNTIVAQDFMSLEVKYRDK